MSLFLLYQKILRFIRVYLLNNDNYSYITITEIVNSGHYFGAYAKRIYYVVDLPKFKIKAGTYGGLLIGRSYVDPTSYLGYDCILDDSFIGINSYIVGKLILSDINTISHAIIKGDNIILTYVSVINSEILGNNIQMCHSSVLSSKVEGSNIRIKNNSTIENILILGQNIYLDDARLSNLELNGNNISITHLDLKFPGKICSDIHLNSDQRYNIIYLGGIYDIIAYLSNYSIYIITKDKKMLLSEYLKTFEHKPVKDILSQYIKAKLTTT